MTSQTDISTAAQFLEKLAKDNPYAKIKLEAIVHNSEITSIDILEITPKWRKKKDG